MTYQEIKNFINTYIVQNGVNAITGAQLNTILNELADYKGFDSVVVTTLPAGSDATATVQGMTLVLGIPKGADGRDGQDGQDGQNAVNPFKGWFDAVVTGEAGSLVITSETQNLPANPIVGDYAYVKTYDISGVAPSQTETPIVKIYECTTAGTWSDSGRTADTSNVQTFASGQEVNEVPIDSSHLKNAPDDSIPTAADVQLMHQQLRGVMLEETKPAYLSQTPDYIVNGENGGLIAIPSSTATAYNEYLLQSGYTKIRFLGVLFKTNKSASNLYKSGYCFGHYSGSTWVPDVYAKFDTGENQEQNSVKEYIIEIPQGSTHFRTISVWGTNVISVQFYLYYQKGDTVGDLLDSQPQKISLLTTANGGYINTDGAFVSNTGIQTYITDVIDVSAYKGKRIAITRDIDNAITVAAWLKDGTLTNNTTPNYCAGYFGRWAHKEKTIIKTIPEDCNYISLYRDNNSKRITYTLSVYNNASKVSIVDLQEFDFYKNDNVFMTRFQVPCEVAHTQQTNWNDMSINTINASEIYMDNCVLYLPSSYSSKGNQTKLIVFCKQGSSKIGINSRNDYSKDNIGSSPILSLPFIPYLINLGYAVLAADGEPDGWLEELGLEAEGEATNADLRCYGNYVAVQSTRRAYEYAMHNYNLDPNGCYVFGYSQGGLLAQNIVDLTEIPVLAVAEISPSCSLHWHQWDNVSQNGQTVGVYTNVTRVARLVLSRMYGFSDANVTNEELAAMDWDSVKEKLLGYDPWIRNAENEFTQFTKDGVYKFSEGVTVDDVQMVKQSKCPLKVWCAEGDTTLGVDVMKAFVKAIKNSGTVADIVVYQTGGHDWFNSQTNVVDPLSGQDATVTVNGVSYTYKPIALDIASWFRSFGGY